jgi:LCCL domain-containing protein
VYAAPMRTGLRVLLIALAAAVAMHAVAAADRAPASKPATQISDIDWQTSPLDLDLRGMNGERYAFRCPAGKPQPSRVTGTGPYTDDSSICTAAVHAGAIRAKDGGEVTIEIRPGEPRYAGSESHYIRSAAYDRAWSGSFVVLKESAAPTP